MDSRLENVDFIKGIMIFLVVCFHIHYAGSLITFYSYTSNFVYAIHIPIFFFFSGYFISTSKSLQQNLYLLVRNLLIPYFLFEMIYILCLFFAGKLGYSFANAINELDAIIILDKLFINPIGAYWYLHNLFLGLLCIYLVSHFIPENIMKQVIVAGIIFYAISLFVKGFRFESILSLLLGYSMKKTKHKIPSELISLIPLLIILFVTLPDLRRGTIASIILLVLVISFLSALYIRYSNVYFSKWSTYIGKNTLIIMLIHPIFLNVFKIFMPYFLKFDSTGIMYLFFTTIFAITLSLSISKYMDKLKVNNIIFGKELYVPLRNIAFNDVDYSKNFRLNKE